MEFPRISIVTPSYNQGKYLERTLLSVLDQGYPNLEYLVIDGGSTDESVAIIKRYADRLSVWVSEPDRGQSHAINKGFQRCTGQILAWLNSDDYLMPEALKAVAEAYRVDPDAGAWVGGCLIVTEGQQEGWVLPGDVLDLKTLGEAWSDNFFGQPSCFFSASAWETCGPLDEALHFSMDLDLWLKMLASYRFAHLPRVVSCASSHPEAKTTAHRSESMAQSWMVLARHGFGQAVEREIAAFVGECDQQRAKLDRVRRNPVFKLWKSYHRLKGGLS